jgi:tetratricopeptide (TPR) repeat protein
MDKLLRRAKKMVNRFAPRPAEKPTPVPVVVTTIVENPEPIHRPTRALPSWLDDWIAQAPPPPPITPLPSAAPNTSPPTERALPQHPVPLHLPQTHTAAQLHDYDIWRLLSRARKYSEAGAFSKAKRLLGEAQHAAKAGGYPALIIEALRVEAQIMSGEANMHRDAHRFYEATTLYEKAIGAMRLARQLRSGKPERLDDISESHYLVSLASIHKDHGRELEAIQALNEAVALLKRHPNLKAEIARIQKLLPTGNNAP